MYSTSDGPLIRAKTQNVFSILLDLLSPQFFLTTALERFMTPKLLWATNHSCDEDQKVVVVPCVVVAAVVAAFLYQNALCI